MHRSKAKEVRRNLALLKKGKSPGQACPCPASLITSSACTMGGGGILYEQLRGGAVGEVHCHREWHGAKVHGKGATIMRVTGCGR